MNTGLFNADIANGHSEKKEKNKPEDFYFKDANSQLMNTSSLRGKVVFINFWASWCPPCRAELPSIMAFYKQFKNDKNIYFLFLNEDTDIKSAIHFLNSNGYQVPFYTQEGQISEQIFTGSLPTTVLLDKKGNMIYYHTGVAKYDSKSFIKQIEQLIEE
ncbi:TlpA family protein disulfide reductase [Arachidicoccus ginsenosidimutans]|uniref:TlpA family protein disulfide reductase n=1 Tax=Arachidicoccus sp. BS20 TaxID=1850526 RepID=UPI0009EDB811|nr:TlpA disulfide reductase family protein [Arachidicoccus sp. BS20]